MIRKAFMIKARSGMSLEYERRHNPIWPGLEKTLKNHGVSNYSIFLHEETGILFCYIEVADEKEFVQIAETDVCRRWWKFMTEVLICDGDQSPKAKEDVLKEVFHLD